MLPYLTISDVVSAAVDARAPRSGQTASGYGPKVPTRYRLTLTDGRTRRVYSAQYGNSGSAYVMRAGESVYLSSDVESALLALANDGASDWPEALRAVGLAPSGWAIARRVLRPAEPTGRVLPFGAARPSSPRAIAARALAGQATARRVIVPETPPAARREYVEARERGEGVALALTRARLEMAADAVLSPTDDFSGWNVDPAALARVTRSPELDALSGTVRDAVTGERLLFPLDVPDGITLTVSTEPDGGRVADEECRTVIVTATDVDGAELSSAALGGVEVGDYWPESEPAQLWPHVPDLIREALADLPTSGDATCGQCGDDRTAVQGEHHGRTVWLCERHAVTCGTCGHVYSDNTPAGRCPLEAFHEPDEDEPTRYRVRFNFTGAANGYHFTEWYDDREDAETFVRLAEHFRELDALIIESEA